MSAALSMAQAIAEWTAMLERSGIRFDADGIAHVAANPPNRFPHGRWWLLLPEPGPGPSIPLPRFGWEPWEKGETDA